MSLSVYLSVFIQGCIFGTTALDWVVLSYLVGIRLLIELFRGVWARFKGVSGCFGPVSDAFSSYLGYLLSYPEGFWPIIGQYSFKWALIKV